jgi:hypothetical protein
MASGICRRNAAPVPRGPTLKSADADDEWESAASATRRTGEPNPSLHDDGGAPGTPSSKPGFGRRFGPRLSPETPIFPSTNILPGADRTATTSPTPGAV